MALLAHKAIVTRIGFFFLSLIHSFFGLMATSFAPFFFLSAAVLFTSKIMASFPEIQHRTHQCHLVFHPWPLQALLTW